MASVSTVEAQVAAGAAAPRYRFSAAEFLQASDAGIFGERVELVDGEVWRVVLGRWHGDVTLAVARALPGAGHRVSASSLPSGDDVPDPDVWVRREDAEPVAQLSERVVVWAAADVALVVEVSDETVRADLTVKARLYGAAGYAVYWVVTREGVHEHTGPYAEGYRRVRLLGPSERVPVPYAPGETLAVADLLAP